MKHVTQEELQAKALNLLSFRPRSVAELRFRLKRLEADIQLVDKVISQLEAEKLIDDVQFASWWVEQRCRFRPKGNIALTSELMQKGVSREVIAGVLLTPEQEKMLAQDLVNQRGWPDKEIISARLLSRGFSTGVVAGIIDEMSQKE